MIDLEKIKEDMGAEDGFSYIDTTLTELIQAISEAKEIMMMDSKYPLRDTFQSRWLSRYFTRKEGE